MELRLYSFVNYYLSPIQQGIQTGHVAVDLVRKYTESGNPFNSKLTVDKEMLVQEWADTWKTFIVLNGGNAENINAITNIISHSDAFPWAIFKEDEQSLGGIQTCVAVILPDVIFDAKLVSGDEGLYYYRWTSENDGYIRYDESHPHFELISALKSCRLAS